MYSTDLVMVMNMVFRYSITLVPVLFRTSVNLYSYGTKHFLFLFFFQEIAGKRSYELRVCPCRFQQPRFYISTSSHMSIHIVIINSSELCRVSVKQSTIQSSVSTIKTHNIPNVLSSLNSCEINLGFAECPAT